MNIKITPAMTHGGTQFTPQQWGEAAKSLAFSEEPEYKAMRTYVSLLYGGVALRGLMSATAGVRLGLAYYRSPALMILANHARSGAVRTAAGAMLQGSKAIRYAGYIQTAINPLMTYKYARRGDYKRAALNYYGPVGTVWVYNRITRQYEKETKQPLVVKPSRRPKTKKPSKISEAQKKRMWRMGLRWCKTHQRYDRCSLRGR